jgi:hypothetical protein
MPLQSPARGTPDHTQPLSPPPVDAPVDPTGEISALLPVASLIAQVIYIPPNSYMHPPAHTLQHFGGLSQTLARATSQASVLIPGPPRLFF